MPKFFKQLLSKLLLPRRIQCQDVQEFHGTAYGGWTISPPIKGIVYSFGVGEDISLEYSLADSYPVTIFAFDPTPRSIEWIKTQQLPVRTHFLDYGVADYDGNAQFYLPENPAYVSHSLLHNAQRGTIEVPMKRLKTIMTELGHTQIEVMKFDIEGAEYAVIKDLIHSGIRPRQILVEFHHRFPHVSVLQTWNAVMRLNRYGYHIFSISPSGEEYSFIRGEK